jgi:hypothetical protein
MITTITIRTKLVQTGSNQKTFKQQLFEQKLFEQQLFERKIFEQKLFGTKIFRTKTFRTEQCLPLAASSAYQNHFVSVKWFALASHSNYCHQSRPSAFSVAFLA